MKALLTLLIVGAITLLWCNEKEAENRATVAEQQLQADNQEVQELTTEVSQLRLQQNRSSTSWFQQRLNGASTMLDPQSPQP